LSVKSRSESTFSVSVLRQYIGLPDYHSHSPFATVGGASTLM
jgi:hypothetical protein